MTTSNGLTRRFPLRKERTVIGREMRSDVRIALPSVAPKHCEIVFRDDELRLTDLDSPQGTHHNGQPVREARLSHTDRLTVGPITFTVEIGEQKPMEAAPPTIETGRFTQHAARAGTGSPPSNSLRPRSVGMTPPSASTDGRTRASG
jgi:pSer/pThr/pTyr-binding forkhead associated (FHA) protein